MKDPSYYDREDCHKWKSTHWSQKDLIIDAIQVRSSIEHNKRDYNITFLYHSSKKY